MTEEEQLNPTMIIQFSDLAAEVDPSVIANILLPILGQIAELNECSFLMKYGAKPASILDEVFEEEEEE